MEIWLGYLTCQAKSCCQVSNQILMVNFPPYTEQGFETKLFVVPLSASSFTNPSRARLLSRWSKKFLVLRFILWKGYLDYIIWCFYAKQLTEIKTWTHDLGTSATSKYPPALGVRRRSWTISAIRGLYISCRTPDCYYGQGTDSWITSGEREAMPANFWKAAVMIWRKVSDWIWWIALLVSILGTNR